MPRGCAAGWFLRQRELPPPCWPARCSLHRHARQAELTGRPGGGSRPGYQQQGCRWRGQPVAARPRRGGLRRWCHWPRPSSGSGRSTRTVGSGRPWGCRRWPQRPTGPGLPDLGQGPVEREPSRAGRPRKHSSLHVGRFQAQPHTCRAGGGNGAAHGRHCAAAHRQGTHAHLIHIVRGEPCHC